MKKKFLNYISKLFILIILSIPLSIIGCDDPSDPTSINIFSLQDDVNLGSELSKQIEKDPTEYPILSLPSAQVYVQNIINEIIKAPDVEHDDVFEYQIKIIQRDNVINAFAAPGGYMYVYTGLLKFLDNEAALAAVLAHEVAHAERRHATKRMTKQYGVTFLLGLLLGDDPSQWEEIASNLLKGLALLKNSRDDEFEADEYSFKYLQSTQWYPGGITYFFKNIDENQGTVLDELLSTHPKSEDRVKAVEEMIVAAKLPAPTENNIFSQRYQDFKKTLP